MGKLTDSQKNFDVGRFFDPDAPSGEPVLEQIKDPISGDVYGPGLRVTADGQVIRLDADPNQLELFSIDENGEPVVTQDQEAQASTGDEEPNWNSSCEFCGQLVDPNDETTYKEIRTWVRGPKKDSAVLRVYTGNLAHGNCIGNLRAGVPATQQDIDELIDSVPESDYVSDVPFGIVLEESFDYRRGYSDGLAGTSMFPADRRPDKYTYGYMRGNSDGRAAKERTDSSES